MLAFSLILFIYIAGRMKLYLLKGQVAILQTYLGKFYIFCTVDNHNSVDYPGV